MKKAVIFTLIIAGIFFPVKVQAEPVTMMILAPLALEAAKQASPHVIAGMRGSGGQLLEIGKDFGNILRLPLGVVQATAGAPFGLLGEGLHNITVGAVAPLQLVGDILLLPFCFF